MTTLTNKLNEELFAELAPAEAEVIQGGWNFEGYDLWYGEGGRLAAANFALPKLKFPNDISSVKINSGVWALYDEPYYRDRLVVLGPGKWNLLPGLNNKTESLRKL
jgi:Beta/Gamma crystallin